MTVFRPGDRVFWWKRITRDIEYPYRAQVVTVGPKRVTIMVEDPDDAGDRLIRHVAAERLQPVAGYHENAVSQGPAILVTAASWGGGSPVIWRSAKTCGQSGMSMSSRMATRSATTGSTGSMTLACSPMPGSTGTARNGPGVSPRRSSPPSSSGFGLRLGRRRCGGDRSRPLKWRGWAPCRYGLQSGGGVRAERDAAPDQAALRHAEGCQRTWQANTTRYAGRICRLGLSRPGAG